MDANKDENTNITAEQLNALIFYMQEHNKFASNKLLGVNGKINHKNQWIRLAELVSKCGPLKDAKQLKAVWARQKKKAKEYNAAKVRAMRQTGNNTDIKFKTDPQMEKILEVVGTTHKNGLNIVPEIGILPSVEKTTRKRKMKNNVVYEFPKAKQLNTTCSSLIDLSVANCIGSTDAVPVGSSLEVNHSSLNETVASESSLFSETVPSFLCSFTAIDQPSTSSNPHQQSLMNLPYVSNERSVQLSLGNCSEVNNAVSAGKTFPTYHSSINETVVSHQSSSPETAHHLHPLKAVEQSSTDQDHHILLKNESVLTRSHCRASPCATSIKEPLNNNNCNENTKENCLLNYSKAYSNYASSWRKSQAVNEKRKKAALTAVTENTDALNRLVEVQNTKLEIMKEHYKRMEEYYKKKLRVVTSQQD